MENREGVKCKYGHHVAAHTAGDITSHRPSEIYYCGRRGDYCRCEGKCPQQCGPTHGCPCLPCIECSDRRGTFSNLRLNSEWNLSKLANDGNYYCQKYFESKSGFGTSTRVCRATTSTKCPPCIQLLLEPPANFKWNRSGFCCRKEQNGYFYCGRAECQSPINRDDDGYFYCGIEFGVVTPNMNNKCLPTNNRSPCEACLELCVVDTPAVKPSTSRGQRRGQSQGLQAQKTSQPGQADDSKLCIICLVEEKTCIVLPCAHYAYCEDCVESLDDCAICRGEITEYKKVFEP